MERVEITVRGEHVAFRPAERATVHGQVVLEASSAEAVYTATGRASDAVTSSVAALHDRERGPVTWWSSDQVRTWAQRPWNAEGKQLPVVHHARTQLQVKFSDFSQMSAWLSQVSSVDGFGVERIEWALTAAHRNALVRDVRMAAVLDAQQKAQTYADALDLGRVHVVAVADAGMLGEGLEPSHASPAAFSRAAASQGDGAVAFVPQDVSVAARVDARFALS